jgi:hypothetical protein
MGIQYREIVRGIKRNNVKLVKGRGYFLPYHKSVCGVGGLLVARLGFEKATDVIYNTPTDYKNSISNAVGEPIERVKALEGGFENFNQEAYPKSVRRYYKIGQRLRALAN